MIRHVWTVFCTRASVDQATNNLNLFEVIEQIGAFGPVPLPPGVAVAIQGNLVSLWCRDNPAEPSQGFARFWWQPPGRERISVGGEQSIDLTMTERNRTIGDVGALTLFGSGRYEYVVEMRQAEANPWQEVARVPVQVDLEVRSG